MVKTATFNPHDRDYENDTERTPDRIVSLSSIGCEQAGFIRKVNDSTSEIYIYRAVVLFDGYDDFPKDWITRAVKLHGGYPQYVYSGMNDTDEAGYVVAQLDEAVLVSVQTDLCEGDMYLELGKETTTDKRFEGKSMIWCDRHSIDVAVIEEDLLVEFSEAFGYLARNQ